MEEATQESLTDQTQKRLEMLRDRTKRCVCKYCGGHLRLKQITFCQYDDDRIEIFCEDCDRLEFGVEPEVYSSAQFFVEETGFNCYPDLDDSGKTKQMTIAKVSEIITWQNQHIGILTPQGYQIPIQMNERFIGECTTYSEDDLLEDD